MSSQPTGARWISSILFFVLLLAFLPAGSCFGHHDDDDHHVICFLDDDFFDDDDCVVIDDDAFDDDFDDPSGLPPEVLEENLSHAIDQYRLVSSDDPFRPRQRFLDIEGVSLFARDGASEYVSDEIAAFTAALLTENASLLGVPEGAGRLLLGAVVFEGRDVSVLWDHVRDGRDDLEHVEDSRVVFRFDKTGWLREIDRLIRLPDGR